MMKPDDVSRDQTQVSLANLETVPLGNYQSMFDRAARDCSGSPSFRARKLKEARHLLALAALAPPRLQVWELDLRQALRVALFFHWPVACMRQPPDGPLEIATHGVLELCYVEEALWHPMPGYAFLQVRVPRRVWHPNVSWDHAQALCLGTSLPAGIRTKDLVLMAFGALTMRLVQRDEMDPAGVLNRDAALWWQQNTTRIPLTKEAFLTPQENHHG